MEELFKSIFDFIHHGVELDSDAGDKFVRAGFAGLCGLLQYACPESKNLKLDALKTIHEGISGTLNASPNNRNL